MIAEARSPVRLDLRAERGVYAGRLQVKIGPIIRQLMFYIEVDWSTNFREQTMKVCKTKMPFSFALSNGYAS